MKTRAVPIHGRDDVGRFVLVAGECHNCREDGVCVKYAPKSFSVANWNLKDEEYTILGSTQNKLGVTCGCYAKFHRQITHIFEKTEAKAKFKPVRNVPSSS